MTRKHSSWRGALLVFGVAIVLRAAFLLEASTKPAFSLVYMDPEYNLEWARGMATGVWNPPYDTLREGPFFRAPLYSMFLAAIWGVFGEKLWIFRSFQAVLGSFSCVLVFLLAKRLYDQRVGILAGLLCACYWVLIYFDSQFLFPVLLVFLVLAGFLALIWSLEQKNMMFGAISGLFFGLFAITRPNILVFFPFLALWGLWAWPGTFKKQILFAFWLAFGAGLPPLAATVYNGVVGDDWVLVASQGGVNFYIGNNPQSNGMQAVVPGTRASWWGGREDTIAIAEQAAGRLLKPSEVSSYWYAKSLDYIREQPVEWLKLTLRKAIAMFGDVEIPNNAPYQARRGEFFTLSAIPLGFAAIFALFLVSTPWILPKKSDFEAQNTARSVILLILVFLATYSASIIAFFVTGRYRMPLVPFFAMGAAVGIVRAHDFIRARQWRSTTALVAVFLLLFGVLKMDFFKIREQTAEFTRLTIAQDHMQLGEWDEAIQQLEAIRQTRRLSMVEVYISLARAYLHRGSPNDAAAILAVAEEGLQLHPSTPELLWYAAVGRVQMADWPHARLWIEQYVLAEPGDVRGLHLAHLVATQQNRHADAQEALRRAQSIDPHHPAVRDMLKASGMGGNTPPFH